MYCICINSTLISHLLPCYHAVTCHLAMRSQPSRGHSCPWPCWGNISPRQMGSFMAWRCIEMFGMGLSLRSHPHMFGLLMALETWMTIADLVHMPRKHREFQWLFFLHALALTDIYPATSCKSQSYPVLQSISHPAPQTSPAAAGTSSADGSWLERPLWCSHQGVEAPGESWCHLHLLYGCVWK